MSEASDEQALLDDAVFMDCSLWEGGEGNLSAPPDRASVESKADVSRDYLSALAWKSNLEPAPIVDRKDPTFNLKIPPVYQHSSDNDCDNENKLFDALVDDVLDNENDSTMEYGKTSIFSQESLQEDQQLTAVQAQARKGVLDAISMLPLDRREAYEFAVKSNPFVVEIETPVERFLLVNNYNFWDSGVQLCDFWTLRRTVMGKERYWLPMRIAPKSPEESALTPGVIEAIQSGTLTILPPDEKNRPVLFWDRELQNEAALGEEVLSQLSLYFVHILCEMDLALQNGYVFLVLPDYVSPEVAPGAPPLPSRTEPTKKGSTMLWDPAIPVKNQAIHQLHIPSLGGIMGPQSPRDHRNVQYLMSWLQQQFADQLLAWNFLRAKLNLYHVADMDEAHKVLCKAGMSPSLHFPQRHPYRGTHNAFFWLQRRVELERRIYQDDTLLAAIAPTKKTMGDNSNNMVYFSDVSDSTVSTTSETRTAHVKTVRTVTTRTVATTTTTTFATASKATQSYGQQTAAPYISSALSVSPSMDDDSAQLKAGKPQHSSQKGARRRIKDDDRKHLLDALISQNQMYLKAEEKRVETLRQEQKLLHANLVRAKYVTTQYERDYQNVLSYLEEVFTMTVAAQTSTQQAPIPSLVKDVLDNLLLFQARNPVTGPWALSCLEEKINVLDDPQVQRAMQDLTQLLHILTEESLDRQFCKGDEPFEDCLSEVPEAMVMSLEESGEMDEDTDTNMSMDNLVLALQKKVSSLQQTNQRLKKDHEFLEASHICAKQTAAEFEQYKRKNLDSFARSMSTAVAVLLSMRKKDGSNERNQLVPDSSSPSWQCMADRVLSKLLWWRAQTTPPKITLDMLSLAMPM